MSRLGYIEHIEVGGDPKKTKGKAGAKRGRVQAADDSGSGVTVEWRWGNRAHSEIGEQGIAQFIAEFMVTQNGYDDEDMSDPRRQREMAKQVKTMTEGIATAAGSALSGAR